MYYPICMVDATTASVYDQWAHWLLLYIFIIRWTVRCNTWNARTTEEKKFRFLPGKVWQKCSDSIWRKKYNRTTNLTYNLGVDFTLLTRGEDDHGTAVSASYKSYAYKIQIYGSTVARRVRCPLSFLQAPGARITNNWCVFGPYIYIYIGIKYRVQIRRAQKIFIEIVSPTSNDV